MNWYDIATVAVTLFLIMDPLGNVPVFNALLCKLDQSRRAKVVARELIIAFFILLATLFVGDTLLTLLGLTQPSLNIAGGVLLFIISLRMIFPAKLHHGDEAADEEPFIVPLAVPLIAGPSTIAVLLLLNSSQPGRILEWMLALFLAWLGTTILLLLSSRLMNLIGTRGSLALERLMGMILVILATQMLLDGIRDFVVTLP